MELRSWSLILLLGFLWGSSFLFVELLLGALTPFSIVYLRVLIASLIFLVFLIIIRPRFQLTKGVILSLFFMAILNNILPFLLIAIGQQSTTGSLASILNANTSLLTILLASIL
ncbi:MAG: EamA family transporter, partial [Alphaproteobacteria bacterium]|nr:EamA family transporter [Alphaproteobacteria bacterium]